MSKARVMAREIRRYRSAGKGGCCGLRNAINLLKSLALRKNNSSLTSAGGEKGGVSASRPAGRKASAGRNSRRRQLCQKRKPR